MGLQTLDDTSVTVRHLLTEELHFGNACLLQGVLEINVLSKADFLVEKCCAALVGQVSTLLLEAPDYTGGTWFNPWAELHTIFETSISERTVHTDVFSCPLSQLVNGGLARRHCKFVFVILETLDDASVVSCDAIEAVFLVSANLFNIVTALLTQLRIQTEVRGTPGHHLLELSLALSTEARSFAVSLQTLLCTAHSWLDIFTELLLVSRAQAEKGGVEAVVVSVLHLLTEELFLAVPGERRTLAAQASLDRTTLRLDTIAEGLGVFFAQLVKHCVSFVVVGSLLFCLEKFLFATRGELLLDFPEAGNNGSGLGVKIGLVTVLLRVHLAGEGKPDIAVDVLGADNLEVPQVHQAADTESSRRHLLLCLLNVAQTLSNTAFPGNHFVAVPLNVSLASVGSGNITSAAHKGNWVCASNDLRSNGVLDWQTSLLEGFILQNFGSVKPGE
mmetsp:Transcript_4821/g.5621  ORF Transcript_4821/g.5621 Transcript_4821/m.5621 type:complete len:446 (-) Transcript_4821:237-1574(-)